MKAPGSANSSRPAPRSADFSRHPAPGLLKSFDWAWQGIVHAARTQRNFKIHLGISAAVIVVGLWVGVPARDWAILALTMGVVLAAEVMNTAVEALVDLASPSYHPLAKVAKDAAAGAVFLLAMAAVAVGLLILGPPLLTRLLPPRLP